MDVKLPFGLKDGELVEISEVDSGLKCNCTCPDPECGGDLIAKKGQKQIHHFAHRPGQDCEHAVETALHRAAKEILARHKTMTLPAVTLGKNEFGLQVKLFEQQEVKFDKVESEKLLGNIRPDLTVEIRGKQLLIEICVTNSVDSFKENKIRQLKVPTLEIRLGRYYKELKREKKQINFWHELEWLLIQDTQYKHWIYNSKKEIVKNAVIKLARPKRTTRFDKNVIYTDPIIENCPISKRTWVKDGLRQGQPFATVFKDCNYCAFCSGKADYTSSGYIKTLYCAGDYKDSIDELIKRIKNTPQQRI